MKAKIVRVRTLNGRKRIQQMSMKIIKKITFTNRKMGREWATPSAFASSNPTEIPPLPNIATSALKMETVCFSETLASTDESTRRLNPEEHHQSNLFLTTLV
jgi:hypothetical protein